MTDDQWMARALALAERARGLTDPNPAVGCVLVRDGEVVGQGATSPPGGPHAEAAALAEAGERARGATAYVTLEPCDHHGRTGPCSLAIAGAGVTRVVVGATEPTALAGGGAERLAAAGIEVVLGVRAEEAREQNPSFFGHARAERPRVTVKVAVSLDGRIAAADGTSQWLTGMEARRAAHALRAESDAVLVGSGTALADDPQLTARLVSAPERQPLRVVLDGRGRTRPGLRVYDDAAASVAVVRPGADAAPLEAAGIEVWRLGGDRATGAPLRATLDELARRGVGSVLVEGGATVATAFVAAGLADRLVVHVAPVLLGRSGLPALGLDVPTLADAPRWRLERVERLGDDAVLTCAAKEA